MLNNICNIHTHIHTKKNHFEFSICMFGWTLNEAVAFKCPKAGNYNPSDYPFRHYCIEWKFMCIHGCRGNRHVVHATNFGQNATTAQKTKSGKLNWTALNQFYPPMPYNRISFWNASLCLCIHTHANTCDVSECWLWMLVTSFHGERIHLTLLQSTEARFEMMKFYGIFNKLFDFALQTDEFLCVWWIHKYLFTSQGRRNARWLCMLIVGDTGCRRWKQILWIPLIYGNQ